MAQPTHESHSERPPGAGGPGDDAGASGAGWKSALWLGGISSALFLSLLPFSSYVASAPLIRDEWELSNAEAALVFSAYLIGYAVSSVVLIPLADRLSPRRVLLASVAVMAVSNLLFPLLATDVWTGSALRFMSGMGHVGAYVPGIQLVSLRFAHGRRGAAVGLFVAMGYAGTTVSYVFMGQLLNAVESWQTAYLVTALVALAGLVPALLLMLARGAERPASAPEQQAAPAGWRLDLSVLRNRPAVLAIAGYTLHTAELYLARLWLPLLLGAMFLQSGAETQEAAARASTWAGLMFMTGVGGVLVGGFVSDYTGRTAGAMLIFAVSGACSFIIGWLIGAPPALMLAIGFVYGLSTAADSAIYSTAVTELSPRGRVGSTQAVQAFIAFTVGAAAPIAAGSVLDAVQGAAGWGLAFSLNGALAVAGVSAMFALRRMPASLRMAQGKR